MSRYVPLPAPAKWVRGLAPERSCPRALDGTWFTVSMSSRVVSLSILLQPQSEPQAEPAVIAMATGSRAGKWAEWVDSKGPDQL